MADNSDDRIRLTLSRSTGFMLDVDLRLPSGGVTVLFGVSGCGKTTVLRSAAGLEKAQGYVRIAGQVWQDGNLAVSSLHNVIVFGRTQRIPVVTCWPRLSDASGSADDVIVTISDGVDVD